MKTKRSFIFSEVRANELMIYRIIKNIPESIGSLKYQKGSTKGKESEVLRFLYENKLVTKKEYNDSLEPWSSAGYYRYSTKTKKN